MRAERSTRRTQNGLKYQRSLSVVIPRRAAPESARNPGINSTEIRLKTFACLSHPSPLIHPSVYVIVTGDLADRPINVDAWFSREFRLSILPEYRGLGQNGLPNHRTRV